jgi:serine/threonine protein kinase
MDHQLFLERIRRSKLLDDDQVELLAGRVGAGLAVDDLCDELVREGLLSPYQLNQIDAGQGDSLVLGQYRIRDEIGKGGFGKVFKAVHAMMGRVVAIKVIAENCVEEVRAINWFRREVRAATQLIHPNIVMAYDADEANGQIFYVMEYVDGPTLGDLIKRRGPLPTDLAMEMLRQTAMGLQHAHEKGMVHRDIKPSNLLVPQAIDDLLEKAPQTAWIDLDACLVKVTDFGLARLHDSTTQTLVSEGKKGFLGTPDFVAPEQARDSHSADIRSDLYSLGCTFYYALTGRKPFRGGAALEVILMHMHEEPRPIESWRPDLPPEICLFIRRLMAKDPASRFQTPIELADAVAAFAGEQQLRPGVPGNLPAAPVAPSEATPNIPGYVPFQEESHPLGPSMSGRGSRQIRLGMQTYLSPPHEEEHVPSPTRLVDGQETDKLEEKAAAETQSPGRATTPTPPWRKIAGVESAVSSVVIETDFKTAWANWTSVIECFIAGKSCKVSEKHYRAQHRLLLERCKQYIEASPNPRERKVFERLESVIEPWLSLGTLATASQATLASLWNNCLRFEEERPLALGEGSLFAWLGLVATAVITILACWLLLR